MNKIGSGDNGELTFLDIIALLSFGIAMENLDLNITQEDFQKTTTKLDEALKKEVNDIHSHLTVQDAKLNYIIKLLERLK